MMLMTVNTIALAKPEKAKMVESMLIQMAQTGQIQGKVTQQFFVATTRVPQACPLTTF